MKIQLTVRIAWISLVTGLSGAIQALPVQAASLNAIPALTPGANCSSHDVNNSGYVVGACTGTPQTAWLYNPLLGSVSAVSPLVPGKPCSADGIAAIGTIIGNCDNASNQQTGVAWNLFDLTTPRNLQVLLAGVRTVPAAQSENFVVGQSVTLLNLSTPAIWVSSLGTVKRIGPVESGCQPVAVQGTSQTTPITIAMNCPGLLGGETAYFVQAETFSSTYIRHPLPIASGSSSCSASGLDSNGELSGTCYDAAGNGRATFWPTSTSAPNVVPLAAGVTSSVVAPMNSSGQILILDTASGQAAPALWDPHANTVTDITALPGCTQNVPVAIADNGRVLMNCGYSTGDVQAFTWSQASGAVSLGLYPGSPSLTCGAIAPNGSAAACVARDNSAHLTAIQASNLP